MSDEEGLRAGCRGLVPLDARLEPRQRELCLAPERLGRLLERYGSPVNVIDPRPMARNAGELASAAATAGVRMTIHFARKANKAMALVDEAGRLGLGVDVASAGELEQTRARGIPGEAIVMTGAVKPPDLIARCLDSGTTLVLDNADELGSAAALAALRDRPAPVALRLTPDLGDGRQASRFGFEAAEARAAAGSGWPAGLRIAGVHFHLDGYRAADRVTALAQALALVDALRDDGHDPAFVDIGGGIPMSYLDDAAQWDAFWAAHREALLGRRPPLTFESRGLGLLEHDGALIGAPAVYPFHQRPVRGPWLGGVLAAELPTGGRAAHEVRRRGLELRCEPGRSLLDGCGMTVARVAFRKRNRDGTCFVGVEMNHTQCRSSSDDFLVDPLLLRAGPDPSAPTEGFLVGAYCNERELLTWRRLCFPRGVAVGDIVVFPNTAGYLMHFLESSSHQIPLARNLVIDGDDVAPDPIHAWTDGDGVGPQPPFREMRMSAPESI